MKRRRGKRLRLFFLFLLAMTATILALLFFLSGPREKIKVVTQKEESGSVTGQEETPRRRITLFFPAEGDELLHPEEREIVASSAEVEAQKIVDELGAGSKLGYLSPLPKDARLRQVFISREGIAYVDFSRELVEKHPSGSAAELTTIYAIVNSLITNIPTIKQVFFLIEGAERETLSGHVNLNQPFSLLPSIIAH